MTARPMPAEQAAELCDDVLSLANTLMARAIKARQTDDVATLTRLQRALARIVARETGKSDGPRSE